MAAFDLLSFDGNPIGAGTTYDFYLDARDTLVRSGSLDSESRRGSYPTVSGTSQESLTLTVRGTRSGIAITAETFRTDVQDWFDPNQNSDGPRLLVMVRGDGVTQVQLACYVVSLEYIGQGVDQFTVTLFAPNPIWEAEMLATSVVGPATVTNDGNVAVLPSVALTTETHKTRRTVTISGGPTGGVVAYPIRVNILDVAATATNVFVYVEGVSVPCVVGDAGLVSSYVWILIDTHSDRVTGTNVDIVYGTGITNSLAGTLDDGGMNLTTSTNSQWAWNDWLVSTFPSRPGTWRPARKGRHSTVPDISYGLLSESTSTTSFQIATAGTYENESDSMLMTIGSSGGSMTNLSRITTNLDGANARAFVRYRQHGSSTWVTAWSTLLNATVTTSIALVAAAEVVAGIENFGVAADTTEVALSGAVALLLTTVPTISAAVVTNYDYYNGTYQVGGRTLTFSNFLCPDGTLTIDCAARSIVSSVAGPMYGSIAFSDPDNWLALAPGNNTITDGIAAADTVAHRAGWS